MGDRDVADDLVVLRAAAAAGSVSPEDLAPAFERLTYALMGPTTEEDRRLRSMVDDIELIRSGALPAHRVAAFADVLDAAQLLFDRVGMRSVPMHAGGRRRQHLAREVASMIGVGETPAPGPADLEFDEHVPVTMTWPGYHRLLDQPVHVTYAGEGRHVDLKFHPETLDIVEVVLVSAAAVRHVEMPLDLPPTGSTEIARLSILFRSRPEPVGSFALTAFDDCLVITLHPDPVSRWVGEAPVLFGADASHHVVVIAVMWGPEDRDRMLSTVVERRR